MHQIYPHKLSLPAWEEWSAAAPPRTSSLRLSWSCCFCLLNSSISSSNLAFFWFRVRMLPSKLFLSSSLRRFSFFSWSVLAMTSFLVRSHWISAASLAEQKQQMQGRYWYVSGVYHISLEGVHLKFTNKKDLILRKIHRLYSWTLCLTHNCEHLKWQKIDGVHIPPVRSAGYASACSYCPAAIDHHMKHKVLENRTAAYTQTWAQVPQTKQPYGYSWRRREDIQAVQLILCGWNRTGRGVEIEPYGNRGRNILLKGVPQKYINSHSGTNTLQENPQMSKATHFSEAAFSCATTLSVRRSNSRWASLIFFFSRSSILFACSISSSWASSSMRLASASLGELQLMLWSLLWPVESSAAQNKLNNHTWNSNRKGNLMMQENINSVQRNKVNCITIRHLQCIPPDPNKHHVHDVLNIDLQGWGGHQQDQCPGSLSQACSSLHTMHKLRPYIVPQTGPCWL